MNFAVWPTARSICSSADDSETDLYKAVGQTRTLSQLCELMMTVSSNLATNLLVERLGADNIAQRCTRFTLTA